MKKLLFVLLWLAIGSGLYARERILNFTAAAQVQRDGKVTITETIEVLAEHKQIKRGIFRDIPLAAPQKITIHGLEMDGRKHPYFMETVSDGKRINFGDDNFITQGIHTYRLIYTLDHVLGRFKNYDEIYWNVTGNYWNFPIEQAQAEVLLPQEAEIIEDKISSYTGRTYAKNTRAVRDGLSFTVSDLQPGEGLTIAVPFKKGVLAEDPTLKQIQLYYVLIHILLVIFLGTTIFYGWEIWKKAGKDPQAKVIRQYNPPTGISPAMARYIWKMDTDLNMFPVMLCSLAMKKAISIQEKKQLLSTHITITKLNSEIQPDLAEEEKYLLDKLPASLEVSNKYNPEIKNLFEQTIKHLKLISNHNLLFSKNKEISIGLLSLPFVIGTVLSLNYAPSHYELQITLIVQDLIFLSTLFFEGPLSSSIRWSICLTAICMLLLAWLLPTGILPWIWWGTLAVATLAGALFFIVKIMPAYSKRGRKLMDEIEGFRQYLQIGEKGRIQESDPTDPLKIFCDYLPYALALDAENKWIASFEQTLGCAAVQQAARQRGFGAHRYISKSIHAISQSCTQSAVKPSSGSGGRGFSGGGFGGGGGGGR